MRSSSFVLSMFAVLAALVFASPAAGQDRHDPADLLEDFVHYTKIAKPDLASASAQVLMDMGLSNADLAELLDNKPGDAVARFDDAIRLATRMPILESIAAELAGRIESGRLDLARDPERIKQAIQMLVGRMRERMHGKKRLEAAGEYAVQPLVAEIVDGKNQELSLACERVLAEHIGRRAVTPLCVALSEVDDDAQRILCNILGEIGYSHAGPYLYELSADPTETAFVRDEAARAFKQIGSAETDVSVLFGTLASEYFAERESLIAYPHESINHVWSYDPFIGLVSTAVSTDIYCEIMAMRTARKSLLYNPQDQASLSLFIAANLRRENQLPAGEDDPVYGDLPYTPMFYATVFGTQTCQNVLARAIDAGDTYLIRDAIEALAKTTGGSNLFTGPNGRMPLVEALRYQSRRAQYEAAFVLGNALPEVGFASDSLVVPTLASAVRTGNRTFAVVVADDDEDIRTTAGLLEGLGFEIVAQGRNAMEVEQGIDQAVAVDLVLVIAADEDAARTAVEEVRLLPKSAAAPVLLNVPATQLARVQRAFRADGRIHAAPSNAGQPALEAAINELMQRAVGGRIDDIESEEYAIAALNTLRDIAISRSTVYDLADAQTALIDALATRTGGIRLMVADILAMIESQQAQHELFDAAFDASGSEQAQLLGIVANSVLRFGNKADTRHIAQLLDLITNASGDIAEAAARVHGTLNLPIDQGITLIPD